MDASSLITMAISRGAPAFNAGDAQQCFNIYKETAGQLLSAPGALPGNGANRLLDALEQAEASRSAVDRAWAMRHGLDDLLLSLRGGGGTIMPSVGTTPSTGEILTGVPVAPPPGSSKLIGDFAKEGPGSWQTVDDRVMGGSSRSRMVKAAEGGAAFEGELVVNGGGFASNRMMIPRSGLGSLRGARGVVLTCASGDGRTGYKLTLKTDGLADGVSYQCAFQPSGDPKSIKIPFDSFKATFRGRPVPNAPPLRGEDIVQLGVMLSRFNSESGRVDEKVAPGGFRLRLIKLEAM